MIAKSAPDGATMGLITASTHGVTPALGNKLPYDPIKDFKPISMIGAAPYVLVLYPGVPAKTVAELVALAKTKPGQLNYGSAGLASLAHLAAALFASDTGIELTHVPYKSSAQSSIDMITGRLDMQFATVGADLAKHPRRQAARARHHRAKARVRAARRADHDRGRRQGLRCRALVRLCRAGRHAGRDRGKLNRDMAAILSDPETAETLRKQGFEPDPGPPDMPFPRASGAKRRIWRALVAKTGIKPE